MGAGTPFQKLIDNRILDYVKLDSILRQRNEILKEAIYAIIDKDIRKSFQRLGETNGLIELRSDDQLNPELNVANYSSDSNLDNIRKDMVDRVVTRYFSYDRKDRLNTLIVTSSNDMRKAINESIRQRLKLENQNGRTVTIETLEMKQLTNQQRKEIANYALDNSVIFTRANTVLAIEKNREYSIDEILPEKNRIILENGVAIDIVKQSKYLNIYQRVRRELMIDEQLKWTSTDRERGIVRGANLVVRDIRKDEINGNAKDKTIIVTLFDTKTNRVIELDTNEDRDILKHLDYSYTTTTYSSQSRTSRNVIYTLESYRPNLTTQKDFYVGISRTRDNITVITDNINRSLQSLLANPGKQLGARDIANGNKLDRTIDTNSHPSGDRQMDWSRDAGMG